MKRWTKKTTHIKVGDLVRSRYRNRWKGRVIEIVDRKGMEPLAICETIQDARGNPHRKPYRKTLSVLWLDKIDAVLEVAQF